MMIFLMILMLGMPILNGQDLDPARVGVTSGTRKLGISEAIQMALLNNLEIEIERSQVELARQASESARGFFDPTLQWLPSIEFRNTATGSVLQGLGGKLKDRFGLQDFHFRQKFPWAGASLNVDFENNRHSTSNPFLSLNPLFTARLRVTYTQPLLRNLRLDRERAEIKIRNKQAHISQVEFEMKVIDVVTRVEQAYWDLVAARQDTQVEGDNVHWAREQLARNRRMIKANSLAPLELSASEAELQRRLDNWYTSKERLNEAENRVKSLLASDRHSALWGQEIIPTDDDVTVVPQKIDLDKAIGQALESRPETRMIKLRQETNRVQKKLNANLLKPQVNLITSYSTMGLGGDVSTLQNPFSGGNNLLQGRIDELSVAAGLPPLPPTQALPIPDILIGGYGTALSNLFSGRFQTLQVGMSIDLTFRNRTAEADFSQSLITERQLNTEMKRTAQSFESQLRNAIQSIQSARQRIVAAKASARAAKLKLDSELRLFQNGESTNFLVLTRQNEYADSRRRVVVANLDFNKAASRLRQALGTTLSTHQIHLQ